jgi:hypothetical protein
VVFMATAVASAGPTQNLAFAEGAERLRSFSLNPSAWKSRLLEPCFDGDLPGRRVERSADRLALEDGPVGARTRDDLLDLVRRVFSASSVRRICASAASSSSPFAHATTSGENARQTPSQAVRSFSFAFGTRLASAERSKGSRSFCSAAKTVGQSPSHWAGVAASTNTVVNPRSIARF